jgi:hypothetical protein
MTTYRLVGLSEEQRLEIEQATGIKTKDAVLWVDKSSADESLRELQEVIGPHGSVSRLQAGGIRITPGTGISIYEDGVLKTSLLPGGDFAVGSDITQSYGTTLYCFVNDQIYNGESMGQGDLLIGNNTAAFPNVKYDASAGQLQFRLGQTINVYVDTDGVLKAGAGVVTLDTNGISIIPTTTPSIVRAYKFRTAAGDVIGGLYGYVQSADNGTIVLGTTDTQRPNTDIAISAYTPVATSGASADISLTAQADDSPEVKILLYSDGSPSSLIWVNANKLDVDTQIFGGVTSTPVIAVDGGTEKVGIGKSSPSEKLDVVGNIGTSGFVGTPGVVGASYTPVDGNYDAIINSLNHIFVNLDSAASAALKVFRVGKGRTGSTGGTSIFQVDTNGFFSFYLENSFMGYPGSTAQGYCPFTSSYNSLFNSLYNHYFIIDSGNGSTTQKFVFAHNGTTEAATEIASLNEAGLFSLMEGGNFAFGTSTGTKIGTATSQKLGFYNSSPIVQPAGDLIAALGNLGLVSAPLIANGAMYADDITQAVTISSANVYYEVPGSMTGGHCSAAFTFQNSKELLCNVAGWYRVIWGMSITSATNNENISGAIMVNSTEVHSTEGSAQCINSSKPIHVSGTGAVQLAVNDVVKLAVQNEDAAHNITVYHANMSLLRIE